MSNSFRLLATSLLFASMALGQTPQETMNLARQSFEANLASGATPRLHLYDGDFRVVETDSDKISIH